MFWTNERVILILAVTAWAASMIFLLFLADIYQKNKKKLTKSIHKAVVKQFENLRLESAPDGYFEESFTYYKPDPVDLREAFRIYRESHKMTQTEMGKMLGISRSAYSVFERGEDLKPENMDRIVKFYWEKID